MPNQPTIRKGDEGVYVLELQRDLNHQLAGCNLDVDGIFGSQTDSSVRSYQGSRGLDVDGIVGDQTWGALNSNAPPLPPPPGGLTSEQITAISQIAASSPIADYSWDDRGRAPAGYTKGVAVAFANTYKQLLRDYSPAVEMAKANTHDADKDVLSWEAGRFDAVGMNNDQSGPDTLRHLWVYILGLGMRESSGEHCCGRDMSVPPGYYGPESTTTEAGAWQTSYDAHGCSDSFDALFNDYNAGQIQGFVDVFKEGVSCSSAEWECYGDGDGYKHQEMSKNQPAYAAAVCAITLRNLRKHYGPVGRREVEIKQSADDMLRRVQDYIDQQEPRVV